MAEENKKLNNKEEKEHFVCEQEGDKFVCHEKEDEQQASLENLNKLPTSGKGNIFIGTLNLMAAPAKAVAKPLKKHFTKKYHGKYTHAKKLFILDMVLLGIIGVLAFINIYMVLGGQFDFFRLADRALLDVSYDKEKIVSGEDITFYFDYLNNSEDLLESAKLTVDLPDNFTVKSYLPESFNTHSHILDVGDLPAGANGKLQITGRLYGSIGEPHEISGVFSYNVGRRQGNQILSASYFIEDSNIGVTPNLPSAVVKNQLFNFSFDYYNDSDEPVDKILIVPEWSADFRLENSDVAYDNNLGGWVIDNLDSGAKGRVEAEGALFTNNEQDTLHLKTYLIFNNKTLLQKDETVGVSIVDPKTSFTINWGEGDEVIDLGEKINYKIKYSNNGDYFIRNIILKAVLESDDLDLGKNSQFIFNYDSNPELALLKPGASGEIDFSFKINNSVAWNKILEQAPVIKSYIITEYILEDEIDRQAREKSATKEQKINTNLHLDSFARYFSGAGDQLGRGPLPPEVDTPTKYWIFWYPVNNLSDATEVIATAILPNNVELTGISLPLNVIEFNPENRQISWNVGRVNKYGGTSGKAVSFEVSLIPSESQIGQPANLLTNIKIIGVDSFTGEQVQKFSSDITTKLNRDNLVKGDGRVER